MAGFTSEHRRPQPHRRPPAHRQVRLEACGYVQLGKTPSRPVQLGPGDCSPIQADASRRRESRPPCLRFRACAPLRRVDKGIPRAITLDEAVSTIRASLIARCVLRQAGYFPSRCKLEHEGIRSPTRARRVSVGGPGALYSKQRGLLGPDETVLGSTRTHVARQRVRANEIRQAASLDCRDNINEGSPSAFAEQLAQILASECYSGADGASCRTYSRRASLVRPQDVVDVLIIDDEARRHQHQSRRPISMSLRLR